MDVDLDPGKIHRDGLRAGTEIKPQLERRSLGLGGEAIHDAETDLELVPHVRESDRIESRSSRTGGAVAQGTRARPILIWSSLQEIIKCGPNHVADGSVLSATEPSYLKSRINQRTERAGLAVLLRDARFQKLPLALKKHVGAQFGLEGRAINAFDAVMTADPAPVLTPWNIDEHLPRLRLIEMKSTTKPVHDSGLGGFFFGATKSEYDIASRLRDRYLFAFVVLNTDNVFGHEFFVLLTYPELEARTRVKRVQYQVNLVAEWSGPESAYGIGPRVPPNTMAAEERLGWPADTGAHDALDRHRRDSG